MPSNFKVGDVVHLNDEGLKVAFGKSSVRALQHMKTAHLTVLVVGTVSLTSPEESFIVEVDLLVDDLLLFDSCFDNVMP